MRYQTALLMQMMQDGKSRPIQPIDVLRFDDEVAEADTTTRQLSDAQSERLNAAYERYINRQ